MNDEQCKGGAGVPASVPAAGVLACRNVIKGCEFSASWLKRATVAEELELSTMLPPSQQTTLWALQGQRPRQLEDGH